MAALLLAGWLVLGPDDGEPTEVATVARSTTLPVRVTSSSPATTSSTTDATDVPTTTGGGLVVSPGSVTTRPPDTTPSDPTTGPVIVPTGPAVTSPPRPTTPPPTTRPPSPRPTTTTTAAPDLTPTVDGFTAAYSGSQCQGGYAWIVSWSTSGAYAVRISGGGATTAGEPDGKTTLCIPVRPGAGPTFSIEAQGLGGRATATTTGIG